MIVFAVFKDGVYRHECAGVFSTEERARGVADKCLAAGDGYHQYEVIPFEVDVDVPMGPSDALDEPARVYYADKPKERPRW